MSTSSSTKFIDETTDENSKLERITEFENHSSISFSSHSLTPQGMMITRKASIIIPPFLLGQRRSINKNVNRDIIDIRVRVSETDDKKDLTKLVSSEEFTLPQIFLSEDEHNAFTQLFEEQEPQKGTFKIVKNISNLDDLFKKTFKIPFHR